MTRSGKYEIILCREGVCIDMPRLTTFRLELTAAEARKLAAQLMDHAADVEELQGEQEQMA